MDDYKLVGRIRPVYKGVWNAETAYTVLETVTTEANNAAYIAIKDVPSGTPLTNVEYWGVLIDASGLRGADGNDGNDGVGIESIDVRTSTVTGGANRITITLTDGTSKSFSVYNGKDGARGATGPAGPQGNDYILTDSDKMEIASLVNSAPDYVVTESKKVSSKVMNNRSPNSITLIMASDLHVDELNPDSVSAITDMGYAMQEIKKRVRPDAFVLMGDYVDNSTQDAENGKADMLFVRNATMAATNGTPTFWLNGNHDGVWNYNNKANVLTPDEVYSYVGAQSDIPGAIVDYANIRRNYGYVDVPNRKTRLIWLNTSDNGDGESTYNCLTNIQLQWIVDYALDLSDKGDDEKNWGVVSFGHIPIQTITWLRDVLDAFKGRKSGSTTANGGTVSYDFTAVKAQHLVHINGHTHNFAAGTHGTYGVLQVGIPNACPYDEDTYGGEATDYPKTQGTAESTSFCAVVIDRDEKTVKAYCYGAGYDRELQWTETAGWTNMLNTSDSDFASGQRLNSSGGTSALTESFVSGYIPASNGDVVRVHAPECDYSGSYGTSYVLMTIFNSSKTKLNTKYGSDVTLDEDGHGWKYTLGSDSNDSGDNIAYIRVGGQPADAAGVIVTLNEEIV